MSISTITNKLTETDAQTLFYQRAEQYIKSLNKKYQEKSVIKKELYDNIFQCLSNKHSKDFDSHFKTWCYTTFEIQNIGTSTFLCDSKKHKPVLLYEDMFTIYKQIHIETAHSGRDKCLDALSTNYSWYSRPLLQIFLNLCESCQTRKTVKIPIYSKPIIELEFLSRVQMDLIDMRTRPDASGDKTYKWILQLKDHFTKFCWARPLENKEAIEVYNCVREIFLLFGPPHILQSDNGREFVNELINSLQLDFPNMHIVHGRPRHPQSQGLIERANAILTDAIGKWMDDNSTDHWSQGLSTVIYSINTRSAQTTKKTPYQLVFGQEPRANFHYWKNLHDTAVNDNIYFDDLIIDKVSLDNITEDRSKTSTLNYCTDTTIEDKRDATTENTKESQYSLYTINSCPTTQPDESRHEKTRKHGRKNYLKAQEKRQKLYDDHIQKIADSFQIGDIAGVCINKVDRTNCDKKIMPCRIQERTNNTDMIMFRLQCPYGQLDTLFPVHQLIPLSGIQPTILQTVKFESTQPISLVQASKLFTRGNATATCDCKTKCRTKTCPCRRATVSCSTKCHSKRGKCLNYESSDSQ